MDDAADVKGKQGGLPAWLGQLSGIFLWIRRYLPELIVAAFTLSVLFILLFRFVPPPFTYLMIKRWISSENKRLEYEWADFHLISPALKVCAMASEDQNLPFHYGLDLEAISKAVDYNAKGKKLRGASTISQQVAKNLFLWPDRSYIRKIFEIYFTLGIETLWKKERILEMYLNIAETGDGIYGVQTASRIFFNKDAAKLNTTEAASIIAVLPSPVRYSATNPGAYVAGRRDKIGRLYKTLDGPFYLRELYVRSENSLYDFRKYKE
jgi:monofunctional glycosyltransferase